jgi:hypothetical protein
LPVPFRSQCRREARRRTLSTTEVAQIIQAEISERLLAARDYERSGHADRAQRLRSEAEILASVAWGEDGTATELADNLEN